MSKEIFKNLCIKFKKKFCKHEFIKSKPMYHISENIYIKRLEIKRRYLYTCKKCGERYFR